MTFREFLKENIVILDGGMGTLLQQQGLTPGQRPEEWNLTRPDAVTAIPAYCFNQCTLLKQIRISSAVASVGARAFSGCESLTSLYFGDAMLSLGDYAFRGCKALETVRLSGDCVLSASAMTDRPDTLTVVTIEDSLCWETCKELGVLFHTDAVQADVHTRQPLRGFVSVQRHGASYGVKQLKFRFH